MIAKVSLYRLDAPDMRTLQAVLDWLEPEQRVRALRFAGEHLTRRFLAAQFHLRRHLGERLGLPAEHLVLVRDAHGKPGLPGQTGLHFNLSHSGEWALVASAGEPVGVDIEARITASRHALASEFLCADSVRAWQARGDPSGALLTQAWCAREAVLKLDGRGLRLDLRALRIDLDLPCRAEWEGGRLHAHVQALPAPDGYHACLASGQPLDPRLEGFD